MSPEQFYEEVPPALRKLHNNLTSTGFTDEQAFSLVQVYFVECLRSSNYGSTTQEPGGDWSDGYMMDDDEEDGDESYFR